MTDRSSDVGRGGGERASRRPAAAVRSRPPGALAALSAQVARGLINRNYTLFMVGAFVSATGGWAQAVALGWLVLDLGNSTFLLGLTNFAQMAPLLLLGFPAGAVVDRVNRRTLLLAGQGSGALVALALTVSSGLGFVSIPLILVLALLSGLCNAIIWPTWSVFIKDLVGPEHLRSAVAVNTARFNLTRVLGPALAGVVLARYGVTPCLAIGGVSGFGVVLALLAIRLPPAERALSRPWLPALGEGLTYAWSDPRIRELLLVTGAVGFLVMPYQAFLPAVARDVLGGGAEVLGLLLTAVGLGAIGGAVVSGSSWAARQHWRAMAVLALFTGLAVVGLASAREFPLAIAALAGIGLGSVGYLAVANATLQLSARDDIVGRVMGLWTVVNAGVTPVGSLALGSAAERVGLTTALGAAGGACVVLGLWLAGRRRPAPAPERRA